MKLATKFLGKESLNLSYKRFSRPGFEGFTIELSSLPSASCFMPAKFVGACTERAKH